ncbi:MAG TPA: hypothetical protein VF582_00860 [Allosphingosinicella sp.]|jgi:hypothetical protein
MVGIIVGKEATKIYIAGHGMAVDAEFELAPSIFLSPQVVRQEDSFGTRTGEEFQTMAAVLATQRIATFSVVVEEQTGGTALAAKGWNALWVFSLLALACRAPVISLYSATNDLLPKFSNANRNVFIRPLRTWRPSDDELAWARKHYQAFISLLSEARFRSAQRYYNNSWYVQDHDARIMLLWAGIESLLDVDQELSRRIALHSAILFDGDGPQKVKRYKQIKRAYVVRSKAIHGNAPDNEAMSESANFAAEVLLSLLRKAVGLGRLPSGAELDEAAASASIS